MEVQQRADEGATESRWRCNREQMKVQQRADEGATESRYIISFNSEMKTTGRKYNKMLETILWLCSVYSCTCNTLRHEQHSATLRPLVWFARLKQRRNFDS